jgi:hypothetical protein
VDSKALLAMPEGAKKYMDEGAGTGPGLDGDDSSHWMGEPSESTATAGSGAPTRTPSGSPAAATAGGGGAEGAAASTAIPMKLVTMFAAGVAFAAAMVL